MTTREGRNVWVALVTVVVGAGLGACASPVNDDKIEKLGGETEGVLQSEFHRPGQPCVLCHDSYEGASPQMAVGGTVFATPSNPVPVEGVTVTLTDSSGITFTKTTNCIGNFFITADEWTPAFPLRAEIECPLPGSDVRRRFVMGTRIGRDGSCAGCHFNAPSQTSPGWVYCAETMPQPAYQVSDTCQGTPR
jgi:hypothetical protein